MLYLYANTLPPLPWQAIRYKRLQRRARAFARPLLAIFSMQPLHCASTAECKYTMVYNHVQAFREPV